MREIHNVEKKKTPQGLLRTFLSLPQKKRGLLFSKNAAPRFAPWGWTGHPQQLWGSKLRIDLWSRKTAAASGTGGSLSLSLSLFLSGPDRIPEMRPAASNRSEPFHCVYVCVYVCVCVCVCVCEAKPQLPTTPSHISFRLAKVGEGERKEKKKDNKKKKPPKRAESTRREKMEQDKTVVPLFVVRGLGLFFFLLLQKAGFLIHGGGGGGGGGGFFFFFFFFFFRDGALVSRHELPIMSIDRSIRQTDTHTHTHTQTQDAFLRSERFKVSD